MLQPSFEKEENKTSYFDAFVHNLNLNLKLTSIDLSIGSTETKYIKLNTKTQNIFCCVNENLTFLYTLTGSTRKQKGKKSFLF